MRSSCDQTACQSTSHRFLGNGMSCPLTALAVRDGAERGGGLDTLLPERITRHTFWFFGTLLAAGLVLLLVRRLGAIG